MCQALFYVVTIQQRKKTDTSPGFGEAYLLLYFDFVRLTLPTPLSDFAHMRSGELE